MKLKRVSKYVFPLILTLALLKVQAAEVSKTIRENFQVTSSTELIVSNSFGRVHVENWDKNEIGVVIELIAESNNDQRAQELLDRIDIDIDEGSSSIYLRTQLGNINSKNRDRIEVNYRISMPAGNPLDIQNKFGDIFTDDREGELSIDLSYGALKTGNLNSRVDLEVAFGSADIGDIQRGDLNIKYSDVEIRDCEQMDVRQQFSDLEIGNVSELELDSKYGSVELGTVGEIEVDVQYSRFEIEELTGSIDMEARYVSGFEIEKVRKEFSEVIISGTFGAYDIGLEEGLSAEFYGEFDYSDLRASGVDIEFRRRIRDNNHSEYQGSIGGGNSSKRISVDSSYGDLRLFSY